jgi:hypothetical protein
MSDAAGDSEIQSKGQSQICGGTSIPKPASEETQKLCNAVSSSSVRL